MRSLDVYSRKKNSSGLQSRGTVVSLLFLIQILWAHSYIDELLSLTTTQYRDKSILFQDSSTLTLNSDYFHFLSISNVDAAGKNSEKVTVNRISSNFAGVLAGEQWGVGGIVRYHRTNGRFYRTEDGEPKDHLELETPFVTGALSAWFHSPLDISLGITLGTTFLSNAMDSSKTFTPQSPLTSMAERYPVTGELAVLYENQRFYAGCNLYRGLTAGMNPVYTNDQSGNYRSMPLYMLSHSSSFSTGIHSGSDTLEASFAILRDWGVPMELDDNALPLLPDFKTFEWKLNGALKKFRTELCYQLGESSMYGYDSYEVNDRYLRFDSLYHKRVYGTFGYEGEKVEGRFFTEHLIGSTDGLNYIDFYPFTSWTVFKPYEYRFSEGDFLCNTYGGEALFHLNRRSWKTSFLLRGSYLISTMSMVRETKKIAVIVPVFVDDTLKTYWDEQYFLGDIGIKHERCIKGAVLSAGIRQLIPIRISNGGKSESGSKNTDSKRVYGGLRVGLNIAIPISKKEHLSTSECDKDFERKTVRLNRKVQL